MKIDDAGLVGFNTKVVVLASEIKTWSPERMSRFFRGLAMVMAAVRGDGEEKVTNDKEPT